MKNLISKGQLSFDEHLLSKGLSWWTAEVVCRIKFLDSVKVRIFSVLNKIRQGIEKIKKM
jgi:hypothetical protein